MVASPDTAITYSLRFSTVRAFLMCKLKADCEAYSVHTVGMITSAHGILANAVEFVRFRDILRPPPPPERYFKTTIINSMGGETEARMEQSSCREGDLSIIPISKVITQFTVLGRQRRRQR